MTRPRVDLVDVVEELTRPHMHREPYSVRRGSTWYGDRHVTNVPSLLAQLELSGQSRRVDDAGAGGYGSRPAGPLEAIDCLGRIDRDAYGLIRSLGGQDVDETRSLARRAKARVLRLHGMTVGLPACGGKRAAGCCDRHDVEHEIRRWWTQARIVTGWDSPAWRPDNTCPLCGVRGGLRIKLADQAGVCVECGETWGPETIALLADHIRGENHEQAETRGEAS